MAMDALARALALKFIKGKANLVDGKVPASELPSYVSDIVEVETYQDLPQPGQINVIYVVKQPTQTTYRWTGTAYLQSDEKSQYYSVKVSSTNITTMGALRDYINGVNSTGLHCFFDFSDFITNAYVCTVLCFTDNNVNYAMIFDIINGRTYIDYSGYQDSEAVQAYVNRLGDNIPRVISITDANTKVQDIIDLLGEVNVVGHHILFDFHTLQAGCYLCTVTYSSNNIVITDIVGSRVAKSTFDANTLLSTILATFKEIGLAEGTLNVINASDIASNRVLTDAQYALFGNGKPTLVKGVVGNVSLNNALFMPITTGASNYYNGIVVSMKSSGTIGTIRGYQVRTDKTLIIKDDANGSIDFGFLTNELYFNGKAIPSYPSSPTIPQVLKYLTGNTLAWENESGFKHIEAPSSTTLTNDQIADIANGAIIDSNFVGSSLSPYTFFKARLYGNVYQGIYVAGNASEQEIGLYRIQTVPKTIDLNPFSRLAFKSVASINGKSLPNYPTTNTEKQLLTIEPNGGSLSFTDTPNKNIADRYDSTATYAVGDICIHDDTLYKCNTAIATPEDWDASHWDATTVAELVSDQSIVIDELKNQTLNVINSNEILNNTLTETQLSLIINGKPTLIKGNLVISSRSMSDIFIISAKLQSGLLVACAFSTGASSIIQQVDLITNANRVLSIGASQYYGLILNNIREINGKPLPVYPASTGSFTLKCVDGVLSWVTD